MRNPLNTWNPMLADARAGIITLPDEVTNAAEGVARLETARLEALAGAVDVHAERSSLRDRFITAAIAGNDWPDVDAFVDLERLETVRGVRIDLLTEAQSGLAGEVTDTIVAHATSIIVDHLRPIHDQAVENIAAAAKLIPEAPTTDMLMRAPEKTRKTWLNLGDQVNTYLRMRAHAERLNRILTVERDTDEEFAQITNMRQVWPTYARGRTVPWQDSDGRLMMLNLLRLGGDLWLPTSAERDKAWMDVHGEQFERQRQSQHNAQAYRAGAGVA